MHHDYTERKLAYILTCIQLPDSRYLFLRKGQLTTVKLFERFNNKQLKEKDKSQENVSDTRAYGERTWPHGRNAEVISHETLRSTKTARVWETPLCTMK